MLGGWILYHSRVNHTIQRDIPYKVPSYLETCVTTAGASGVAEVRIALRSSQAEADPQVGSWDTSVWPYALSAM